MKSRAILAVLALATAVFAAPAAAQMRGGAAYIGGGVGQSQIEVGTCGSPCDDKGTTFKLFGGYQFHPMVAGEVTYTDSGETTFGTSNVRATIWDVSAVGAWPIGQFAVIGRLGWYWGDLKSTTPSTGGETKGGSDGWLYGIGGQFMATPSLGARAELTRFTDMGGGSFGTKGDVQTLNVSLFWRF